MISVVSRNTVQETLLYSILTRYANNLKLSCIMNYEVYATSKQSPQYNNRTWHVNVIRHALWMRS